MYSFRFIWDFIVQSHIGVSCHVVETWHWSRWSSSSFCWARISVLFIIRLHLGWSAQSECEVPPVLQIPELSRWPAQLPEQLSQCPVKSGTSSWNPTWGLGGGVHPSCYIVWPPLNLGPRSETSSWPSFLLATSPSIPLLPFQDPVQSSCWQLHFITKIFNFINFPMLSYILLYIS